MRAKSGHFFSSLCIPWVSLQSNFWIYPLVDVCVCQTSGILPIFHRLGRSKTFQICLRHFEKYLYSLNLSISTLIRLRLCLRLLINENCLMSQIFFALLSKFRTSTPLHVETRIQTLLLFAFLISLLSLSNNSNLSYYELQ